MMLEMLSWIPFIFTMIGSVGLLIIFGDRDDR